jgi:glyoxylase-like metal-dependent hydrolase (beta-lactamase superfamily II)
MRGLLRTAAVALALMAPVAGSLAAPAPATGLAAVPAPVIRPELLRQLSPHVHYIPDESRPVVPNVGFVVGTTGVLVVDTGIGARNGAMLAEVAAKLAPGRTVYIIGTHPHPEHDLGAQGFPASARMIRSRAAEGDLDAGMQLAGLFASSNAAMAQMLEGRAWRKADIVFDAEHLLDLGGGVTARLISLGANHTGGDTAIWVPGDRVLFSGDVAMRHQPAPNTPKTSLANWMRSLDVMEALNPAIVVPAHGPNGEGAAFMQGYRAYFNAVLERTRAAKARGLTEAAAADAVAAELSGRYPDRGRLNGAVRLAYAAS